MDLNLSGKVVAITGGSGGIGRALALEYAKEGCRLAVCGRSLEKLDAIRSELESMHCEVLTEQLDVANTFGIKVFCDNVVKHFGHVDIWINNAGINDCWKNVIDYTPKDWDYVMNTNLKSVVFGTQYAAESMISKGIRGVIVNMSSFASFVPPTLNPLYSAAKAAINSATRTFAAECAPKGIRVLAVAPGWINTEMSDVSAEANDMQAVYADISMHRMGEADEVAKPVLFLSSDAAGYLTGICMDISGGKYAVQRPEAAWQLSK
jgi:NAD(P)-dependent dehydrogenase (short-subunit alcohol dehydrogenase family)